jgi:H+/Cl- antiporter ClcA
LIKKLLAIIAVIGCGSVSGAYILLQRWYLDITAIYFNQQLNGTWVAAVDVTNFMIGMWAVTIYAIILGFVMGYVYGKTFK